MWEQSDTAWALRADQAVRPEDGYAFVLFSKSRLAHRDAVIDYKLDVGTAGQSNRKAWKTSKKGGCFLAVLTQRDSVVNSALLEALSEDSIKRSRS